MAQILELELENEEENGEQLQLLWLCITSTLTDSTSMTLLQTFYMASYAYQVSFISLTMFIVTS